MEDASNALKDLFGMELIALKKRVRLITRIQLNRMLRGDRLMVQVQTQVKNPVHKKEEVIDNKLVKKVLPLHKLLKNSIPTSRMLDLKIHQKDLINTITVKAKRQIEIKLLNKIEDKVIEMLSNQEVQFQMLPQGFLQMVRQRLMTPLIFGKKRSH